MAFWALSGRLLQAVYLGQQAQFWTWSVMWLDGFLRIFTLTVDGLILVTLGKDKLLPCRVITPAGAKNRRKDSVEYEETGQVT